MKTAQTKKMVAPSAQKWERWCLAGVNYRPTVPVARKVRKIASFVNKTPRTSGVAPSGQLGASRRFLLFQSPIILLPLDLWSN